MASNNGNNNGNNNNAPPDWAMPPGAGGAQQQQQQQQQPGYYHPQQQQQQQQQFPRYPPQNATASAAYPGQAQASQTQFYHQQQLQQQQYMHQQLQHHQQHQHATANRPVVSPPPSSGGLPAGVHAGTLPAVQSSRSFEAGTSRPSSRSNTPPPQPLMAVPPPHRPSQAQAPQLVTTADSNINKKVDADPSTQQTVAKVRYSRIDMLEQKVLVPRTADEEAEDGRIRNKEAMDKISESWVHRQIRARIREFTSYSQSLLFCGTWNVNAKGKEEGLEEFICSDWGPNHQYAPDIIAVGFQEIVDLNAVNVAVDSKTQQRTQYWVERLLQTVNAPKLTRNNPQRNGYLLIHQQSLVGLLICVLVKMPHRDAVTHVSSNVVGVGVMGMMGNKGGVAIRLQFYASTLCFVCSHLAAHRENVAGRNADFANVLNKCNFEIGERAVTELIHNGSMSQWTSGNSSIGIADHDVVLWLGDLNYRIDESMPTETVLKLAEAKDLAPLLKLDQLNIERAEGRVFDGFMEGPITFPPTYKYQPGTDIYEQRPDKKLRAPAWCDRILWMAQDPSYIKQWTYKRSETPNISDHKPVYSTMQLVVKRVDRNKRDAIRRELTALLDRYENQSLPVVGLDSNELDFGMIRYQQSVTLPIRITNTGNVVAKFRFVPKLDENTLCKSWLSIQPTYGLLIPGGKSLTVNVTLTIDNHTAQMLNASREVLDDKLVLRLENGRDYYLTVTAKYARSCFGMSYDDLVLYKDPVRNVPLDPLKRIQNPQHDISPAHALCIPKELWRLVDAIHEKGLQTASLFAMTPLNHTETTTAIREALDTGSPFPPNLPVHCYVEALHQFCSSLASPIIPTELYPATEVGPETIQSLTRKFLKDLGPIQYNIVVYLISFFRECLLHTEKNGLSAPHLARVTLRICAPPDPTIVLDSGSHTRRANMLLILLHLLETSSI